ncbi:LCP family protein [Macrococcus lamae]|uniref:LytR family transcriptional regulator n=1 Tax=Macrococcus lamae TaxID=198484 RepID=A0A4R6BVT8_9STAP|nr:LCP family protein [Macrococcus lamae]TDM12413.1 LytR family transcriptional regulator [Macrococcus lamae]
MNKYFKALLIVLSLSLIIVPVTYAGFLYLTTKGAIDQSFSDGTKKSNLRENNVDPAMDHVSILFLGIDDSLSRRKGGQKVSEARTDAMILATFNRDKKQIRLISIPRDTLAYIPSVKYYDKITHAHAEGGPESSMYAVEHLFNVPVDYYARVNMQAFVDIIDELGGIYFDVPFDMDEPTKNDKGRIKVKEGYQLLNGDQALALVRSRHIDTDLGRGKRQMEMIEAIVKKAQGTDSLAKLDELVEIVGNNAKHSLTFNNITSLASFYSANDVEFKQAQLKGTDYMYEGVYYFNPVFKDITRISRLVRNDLGLSQGNKEDLLDYKVISLFGDLIPLKKINISDINQELKEQEKNEKAKQSEEKTAEESPTSEQTDRQERTSESPVITAEEPSTAPPVSESVTSEPVTSEQVEVESVTPQNSTTEVFNNNIQTNTFQQTTESYNNQ